MSQFYRAAVLKAPGEIEMQERALPSFLDPHEVLVEVAYAGVCGTDLAIFSGAYRVPLPLVLGHEFSGRVVAAGKSAQARRLVGKRVTGEINATCRAWRRRARCAACRQGLTNHCQQRTVVGIVRHDGAFAEYLLLPVGCVHRLPRSIPLKAAIFIEPLAAAIRTFELAPLPAKSTIVVLGCGRLGKLVTLVAAKMGLRVVAVARRPLSLLPVQPFIEKGFCLHTPAEFYETRKKITCLQNEGELVMAVMDLTHGLGADMVVEATGDPAQLVLATKLVRPQGIISLKSTPGVLTPPLDATLLAVDEIRLQGSRCGPFDQAIEFMETHGLPDASWITAEFPLDRLGEAFAAARSRPKVVVRVAGEPEAE